MKDANVKRASSLHTILYRTTNGLIGRRLVNNDMLLLTTRGRHTGDSHTVPLLYLRDDERLIVIASYGGRPNHPEWYLNLLTEPAVDVQIRETRFVASATTMTAGERAEWWPDVVAAHADYALYQSRTEREIPVVWLDS